MIKISQPSMALNSPDSVGRVAMWSTRDVDPSTPADVMMRTVRQVAMGTREGRLHCLIVHCHGLYKGVDSNGHFRGGFDDDFTGGYGLLIGKGLNRGNVGVWSLLKKADGSPLVGNIMIIACGAARQSPMDSHGDGDGKAFCGDIAKQSGSIVTAAKTKQFHPLGQSTPYYLPEWTGVVQQFEPTRGAVIWEHDYGIGWVYRAHSGIN